MTTTPKLQGLAKAMKMLESDLEDDSGKLMKKVADLGARGKAAIAKADQKLDAKAAILDEIETYVKDLEGSNGGDPLDGSSNTSEKPPETATPVGGSSG